MEQASRQWWQNVLAGPDGVFSDQASENSSEGYAALPRPSDPRVLVDLECPQAMRDVLERMASTRTSNSTVTVMAGSLSTVLSRRKPDWVVRSDGTLGTLREHLSNVLATDVRLSIAVGPPRPNRKPIVRCYAADELVAVAKLGPDPHTLAMVENEATWLSTFMETPLPNIATPQVIHSGSYGESELLVMAPLDLIDDTGVPMGDMPMETLHCFVRERIQPEVTVAQTPWFRRLADRLGPDQWTSLAETVDRVLNDPVFGELEVSAWHGDWSPWNTGQTSSGKLAIWDWERTTAGVPTGLDVLHLHYQYGSGFSGATLDLASFGIPTSQHRMLEILYLLEVCARHNEADALQTDRHQQIRNSLRAAVDDWS